MSLTASSPKARSRSNCSVAARIAASAGWVRVEDAVWVLAEELTRARLTHERGPEPNTLSTRHTVSYRRASMRRTSFEPEHADYRESVRRFIAEEITPHHGQGGREGIVPRELFARAAEKGMLAMQVPEQYGGLGVEDFRFNQI